MRLATVTRTQPANAALKNGAVRPEGVELEFQEVEPITAAFRQMVRERPYDVAEMAFTTYLCAREHGKRFTALPIFLVRAFHHGAIRAAEPGDPKRLEGARVGVNRGYTVTGGVWARGVLATEHGVDLDSITWVRSGDEHVEEYEPPPNVVPLEEGKGLADCVLNGELAAAVGDVPDPRLVPLIRDAQEAGFDALRERGHYPINHLVVMKDELLEHAPAVFDAFERAKDLYVRGGELEPLHARVAELTGADPLPYGVEANRTAIEELIDHAVRQKILWTRPDVDSLFAPV